MKLPEIAPVEAFHVPGEPVPGRGMFRDTPAMTYHRWKAASNSRLKIIHDYSPAHLATALASDADDATAYKDFGTAVHFAVLQPDLFTDHFVVSEQCVAITGKQEQCVNKGLVLDHEGWKCGVHGKKAPPMEKTVLDSDTYSRVIGARDAAWRNPDLRRILMGLDPQEVELSAAWEDMETGEVIKGRFDARNRMEGCLLDVKTTDDASPRAFSRALHKWGYYRQGSLYLDGQSILDEALPKFYFVAIEQHPPHATAVYWLLPDAREKGDHDNRQLINIYHECESTGIWPSYEAAGIRGITLPPWAWDR